MAAGHDVVRNDWPDGGRYVIHIGEHEAEMTYRRAGRHLLRVEHTSVPDALAGQGIGMRLIEAAIADARREGARIEPVCPYVAGRFRRHPEWSDLLVEPSPKRPAISS